MYKQYIDLYYIIIGKDKNDIIKEVECKIIKTENLIKYFPLSKKIYCKYKKNNKTYVKKLNINFTIHNFLEDDVYNFTYLKNSKTIIKYQDKWLEKYNILGK